MDIYCTESFDHYRHINVGLIYLVDKARAELEQVPKVRNGT